MSKEHSIGKWGNSLAVRLPKDILDLAHLHLKDSVVISVRKGAIIIEPKERKPTLSELLEDYEPSEVADWGEPKGKEIW